MRTVPPSDYVISEKCRYYYYLFAKILKIRSVIGKYFQNWNYIPCIQSTISSPQVNAVILRLRNSNLYNYFKFGNLISVVTPIVLLCHFTMTFSNFTISFSLAKVCPEGEEFNKCGSACPKTCKDPGPVSCTRQCVAGCFCKDGLVRNDQNKCVPPSDCFTPSKYNHYLFG